MSEERAPILPFVALILAMLPAVLDQTILATALPTIASDLGSLSDVSWLVTAYVVTATASTPLWGKLGDSHGRKRLLQTSLVVFVSASALCGLAQDMTQLIALRAIQGAGAGGLMTLAMACVGDIVSPRERGKYQGYIALVFAGATVLGPLVGGLLVDGASWRWVFYVNVPLGILALATLATKLPAVPGREGTKPLDIGGAVLLVGATVALMFVCIWGGARYDWLSAPIVLLAAAAIGLAIALVARERRAPDPILPLTMLREKTIAISSTALFMTTAALFSMTVFVPLMLQKTAGASPTEAGLLLVPMTLGMTASTMAAGRYIARTGRYRHLPPIGLGLMAVALVLLAFVAGEHSKALTAGVLVIAGLGFGLVTQILIVAVQNAVERTELGTATGVTNFFRALGGAVGAAGLGAVFAAQVDGGITNAVQTVFLCAAPLALVGLAVVLRLPGRELRTK